MSNGQAASNDFLDMQCLAKHERHRQSQASLLMPSDPLQVELATHVLVWVHLADLAHLLLSFSSGIWTIRRKWLEENRLGLLVCFRPGRQPRSILMLETFGPRGAVAYLGPLRARDCAGHDGVPNQHRFGRSSVFTLSEGLGYVLGSAASKLLAANVVLLLLVSASSVVLFPPHQGGEREHERKCVGMSC